MKKLFFLLSVFVFLQGKAQPPSGIAPNFTLRDLNGNWHTLYDYLDQGKTVFIDFSAAWCNPCWNFHNSHVLRDLYEQHGPAGHPGVSPTTTNDVMVFFMEGEPNNTRNQLYGIAGTGSSQSTQGNWVNGTPYPILDTNAATTTAICNAWGVTGFPTIFMVCRDRLVQKHVQLSAAMYYSAAQYNCPSYPPVATPDAKVLPYTGREYYFCTPSPGLRFQNYSTGSTITNATINFYSNTTLVNTYNWTGSLGPYAVATVQVPPFAANPYSGYRYEIAVTGDAQLSNNKSADSLFWVYSPANAAPLPAQYDFEASPLLPHKFKRTSYDVDLSTGTINATPIINVKGVNGQNTRAVRFQNYNMWWYETADLVIGNYNTNVAGGVKLEFDMAYAQINGSENDTLEVLVSTDCGATWQCPWRKSGNTLKTRTPVGNFKEFYPQAANEWRHEEVNLTPYKNAHTIIVIRIHSNMGNNAWVDNIKLAPGTVSVSEQEAVIRDLSLFPNPAHGNTILSVTTASAMPDAAVRITDALGKTVLRHSLRIGQAGSYEFSLPVGELGKGLYLVTLSGRGSCMSTRLLVQ